MLVINKFEHKRGMFGYTRVPFFLNRAGIELRDNRSAETFLTDRMYLTEILSENLYLRRSMADTSVHT